MSELIDYGTLEWFDCKNNFPPMHIDLYVDSEHGYGIGRLGKRVKDGSIIWVVHLDSGKVYLVYAFYKVKRWAYMPKERKKSELKAFVARKIDDGTCDPVPCIEVYLKSEADKVIARYKYKHCLDMAYKCVKLCQKSKDRYRWAEDENLEHYYNHKIEFFARWHKRWLELAEKFKEAD